jgi:hypothetical protein
MRAKRLFLSSTCATVVVLGLICVLAVLDDTFSPNLPPGFVRYVVLIAAWPFAVTSAVLHGDPPPGLCWWVLLAASGLFWGAAGELLLVLKNARKP